jgi:hypothetical protein
MALPTTDHVARTCKASTLDPRTKQPTPASFEFRLNDDDGWEAYLSVNWLELLPCDLDSIEGKVDTLRRYQLQNPHKLDVIKPTRSNMYAVLPVAAVRAEAVVNGTTALECEHEPEAEGDPHSGVFPQPGTHDWSNVPDDPIHLAVQQYLFESISHAEPGVLPLMN